jgi:phosphoketolase
MSMRASNRAGGRVCGVDMVMIAEMLDEGRSDVATIPPIEWPMIIMEVPEGYKDKMYAMAREVYAVWASRVGPWNADRSSLNSTAISGSQSSCFEQGKQYAPAKKSSGFKARDRNSGATEYGAS